MGNSDGTGAKSDAGDTGMCIECTRLCAGEMESPDVPQMVREGGRYVGCMKTAAVGDGNQARSWMLEVLDGTDNLGDWVGMSSKHTGVANHTNMAGNHSNHVTCQKHQTSCQTMETC